MDAREVWYGQSAGARLVRTALTPISWLYAAGWQTYLRMYRDGLKVAAEPHRPVVCVGNLMIGGTGKSPMTVYLAGLLRSLDRKVAISASGYGGPHASAAAVAPDGPLLASEWGDEPAMIRWLLPEVPLIVGRRRVLAASLCHERFPDHILLMDDGFQHLPLRKHLTVLLDPENTANPRCLPAGPYREPRRNRSRASIVLPGDFRVVEGQAAFFDPAGSRSIEGPELGDFTVLCALGQPDRFLLSLPRKPKAALLMPDHDPLTAGTLLRGLPNDLPVVVTAKDWVKLRERPDVAERRFLVVRHSLKVEPEDAFRAWLVKSLDEIQASS